MAQADIMEQAGQEILMAPIQEAQDNFQQIQMTPTMIPTSLNMEAILGTRQALDTITTRPT